MITTDMSANMVSSLLKRRWSLKRIAQTIDAPVSFVQGIQAKKHVLTLADVTALAQATGQTAPLMIFNSITDIPSHVRPLFDVTRQSLEASSKLESSLRQKSPKRRRSGTKAA